MARKNAGENARCWQFRLFENLSGIGFAAIYSDVLRYILPLLALLILWRCGRSLLTFRREPEVGRGLPRPPARRSP